jgi:hypothetical protein
MRNRHDDVVRGLAEACRPGDVTAIRAVLDARVVAVCDGGGPRGAVCGTDDVALLIAALLSERSGGELTVEAVNGRSGLALRRAGRAVAVVAVSTAAARVAILWIVLSPAKLRRWHRC